MSGRRLAFWYFFLLIVLVVAIASSTELTALNRGWRWLLGGLGIFLLLGPALFWRAGKHAFFSVAAQTDMLRQLDEAKKAVTESQAKARELEAKDVELAQANKRLQALDQAKSEFISVATHQLRTPLAAIKWTFHMMINNELGVVTEEQKQFLKRGYQSATRVITIVNDLLRSDMEDASAGEYKFVPTNLTELVDGVVFEFSGRKKEKNITLEVTRPKSNMPDIEMDPIRISMALENLLDNAIKYTPAGGKVTVTVNDDKINSARAVVEVIITDSGIGVSAEDKNKIFQRFFRGANAVSSTPDGMGLGLYIAKQIVEKHGGEIWFLSPSVGGTEFHFTIPVRRNKV